MLEGVNVSICKEIGKTTSRGNKFENKLPSTFLKRLQSSPTQMFNKYSIENTIHVMIFNKQFLRVDQAYSPFIHNKRYFEMLNNIQRYFSLIHSCKYTATTWAYHGNKVYIEISMAIQRDLCDH